MVGFRLCLERTTAAGAVAGLWAPGVVAPALTLDNGLRFGEAIEDFVNSEQPAVTVSVSTAKSETAKCSRWFSVSGSFKCFSRPPPSVF